MVSVDHEFKTTPNVPLTIKTEEEQRMFKEAEGTKKFIKQKYLIVNF